MPTDEVEGVKYVSGSVLDADFLPQVIQKADVVVSALSTRSGLTGEIREVTAAISGLASDAGARFGVIGGAGSLLVSPGGPKAYETEGFPPQYLDEAIEMEDVLEDLRETDESFDWFYVSPAAGFGDWAPGEATGSYRMGGDVRLVDDKGESFISGADLATAVVEEITNPTRHRARFTLAY